MTIYRGARAVIEGGAQLGISQKFADVSARKVKPWRELSVVSEIRRKGEAFICSKQTDLSGVETEPIKRKQPANAPAKQSAPAPEKNGEERELLAQTDRELGRLLSSRRFKLAQAIGSAFQALGISKGEAPEDRLRELRGRLKAR